ncbi:protein IQ-DOMAIN 17-like [Apium graveolens]|uniref:protein IQ-DOMAIN 17-like n=1 Tax=Apium graveolens TaxID=4045 RepID=UPI003D7A3169
MGKNIAAGNSWLDVVKKAFRSPIKSTKSSKRREEHEQEDDEKKRGKRRWIFSKQCINETTIQHYASASIAADTCFGKSSAQTLAVNPKALVDDYNRRDIALATATTATAEAVAAVAAVQAAVEVIRLASPSKTTSKYFRAAIMIQSAFRGYLARRALLALRGIVKLQALVRGQNIRKQAKMTLRCIQSLVRVQTRVRDQRRRLSYEGSRDSTFSVSNSSREYRVETRKSRSREGSNITDEWDCHRHTLEEIKAMLQKTKLAASEQKNQLTTAFSRQTWRSGKDQFLCSEGEEEKYGWSDQWKKIGRHSSDRSDSIKSVETDTAQSYSVPRSRLSIDQQYLYHQNPSSESDCFPMHRTNRSMSNSSPIMPFQYRTKYLQVHSASPRCLKYARNFMKAQTPTPVPNYMAATASAMARSWSESAPRQRPLTPDRGNLSSAKKRLSFAAPERDACAVMSDTESERNLCSPSSIYGMRERSNTLSRGQPW